MNFQDLHVELSVGGTLLSTRLSTLMNGAHKSDIIKTMCFSISERINSSIDTRQAGGCLMMTEPSVQVSLDRDGISWPHILNYFRANCQGSDPAKVIDLVHLSYRERTMLAIEAKWLGLTELIDLLQSTADFSRRELQKILAKVNSANLCGSNLQNLDLRQLDFSSCRFDMANMRNCNLEGCKMTRVSLFGTDLTGANMISVQLQGVDVRNACFKNAKMKGADFSGANLSGCDLSGIDLRNANFSGAILINVQFRGTNLNAADFRNADLREVVFLDAILERCNLSSANLERSKISTSDLSDANLEMCNLTHATCQNTRFVRANLSSARLSHAKLSSCDFTDTILKKSRVNPASLAGIYALPIRSRPFGSQPLRDFFFNPRERFKKMGDRSASPPDLCLIWSSSGHSEWI